MCKTYNSPGRDRYAGIREFRLAVARCRNRVKMNETNQQEEN
jgi:hypothetical protein